MIYTGVKVRHDRSVSLPDKARAKVVTMGNVIEVTAMDKISRGAPVRKLDKDRFVDGRTGEVREYQHAETRADNVASVRRSLAVVRALVNCNVTVPKNCLWVTLTYAENMTDTGRLYADYDRFWKRFKYYCKGHDIPVPEYINVVEPQGRGAWHCHVFLCWSRPAPFLPNDEVIAPLWGHGWTKTKAIKDCDNVGAYFSAYLGDMPLDEVDRLPDDLRAAAMDVAGEVQEKAFTDDRGTEKRKAFVKGARLVLYPAGMNICRTSRGVKRPVEEVMTLKMARKKASSGKLTFASSFELSGDDGVCLNRIIKEQYNMVRGKAQAGKKGD